MAVTAPVIQAETPTGHVELLITYNASNGRAQSLTCNNGSTQSIRGWALLTNGQRFDQSFPPGTTNVTLPGNAITVTVDAQGELTLNGVAEMGVIT